MKPNGLDQLRSELENPIPVPIYVKYGDYGFNFPDLVEAAQFQLDRVQPKSKFNFTLIDKLELGGGDVYIPDNEYIVELQLVDEVAAILDNEDPHILFVYSLKTIHSNDLPYYMTQTISDHLIHSDLMKFEIPDLKNPVNIEIVQIGDDKLDISKNVTSYLNNHTFSFLEFNVTYSTVADAPRLANNNTFYFQVNGTNEDVFNISESEDFTAFYDEVYYGLEKILALPERPQNNMNIRMFSLLKSVVISQVHKKVEDLGNQGITSKHDPQIQQVKTIIDELYTLQKDWISIYKKVKDW